MFIVRDRETRQNDLALSVRDDDGIKHYQIVCHDSGEFTIFSRGFSFDTLTDLISHYKQKNGKSSIRLSDPLPTKWPILQSMIDKDPWEVPRESISTTNILQEGLYHKVLEGMWNESIDVSVRRSITLSRVDFLKQIKVMKKLSHPHVVQLYGYCSDCNPPLIVTEPVKNGYLLNYLREDKGKSLKLPQLLDISIQVASGMAYLDKHNVLHRNLGARNVAVVAKNMFKIDNFRLATFISLMDKLDEKQEFPIKWMPPEVLCGGEFSTKTDVWSFGILLYEIITT